MTYAEEIAALRAAVEALSRDLDREQGWTNESLKAVETAGYIDGRDGRRRWRSPRAIRRKLASR